MRSLALSKTYMMSVLGALSMLVVSAYGFWLWSHAPEEDTRQIYLVVLGFFPLIVFMGITLHMAMRVGRMASSTGFQLRIDQLQKRLNAQDDFVRSVTDYAPSAMTIFDNRNEYWFVNARAAESLGFSNEAVLGKTPVALLGAERGRRIERSIDQVRESGKPLDILAHDTDAKGADRYLQTHYQPMPPIGDFSGGVIAREEDVSSIMLERERHETTLRQIISTLVAVVDRRDPYASGHSARVGMLSRALAVEMQLAEREIEAAEIAGSLMNFGKVLVSRAILTKTAGLTQEELQRIRDGILTSADILSMIDFGAPVVPTLRQVLERVDGTGVPDGLKGEAILMTARIVAVANAFVAMVSPRAYRPGIEVLTAAERLAQDAGKAFDARVIAALQNYLRKNGERLSWLTVTRAS